MRKSSRPSHPWSQSQKRFNFRHEAESLGLFGKVISGESYIFEEAGSLRQSGDSTQYSLISSPEMIQGAEFHLEFHQNGHCLP